MIISKKHVTTKNAIIIGAMVLTAWLFVNGLWHADGFVMSFASSGMVDTVLRAAMFAALLAVLVSSPPRSVPFRFFLGGLSSVILIAACASMVDYRIGILDALLYLEVSIIFALEAIETQTSGVQFAQAQSSNL